MTVDAEQRSRLLRTKLLALTRALRTESGASVAPVDGSASEVGGQPVSAGAITAVAVDDHAYVLAESGSARALASALVWSSRQGVTSLTVFADPPANDVARWASYFELGGRPIDVREVRGAASNEAEPTPVPDPTPDPDGAEVLSRQLSDAGLEVVVEHGVVRGELLGLEVARLVTWPGEVGGDGRLHLEAGVGRFDRDAVAAAHPDEAPEEALARAIAAVSAHRYPGAPAHPVQMLSRERWLRALVVSDPALVGANDLTAVAMTTEAGGLRDAHPAAAFGHDTNGDNVVVVCSSGVDLALVPLAADTRELYDPEARLILALPARDHHAATIALATMLRRPAEVVAVPEGWG